MASNINFMDLDTFTKIKQTNQNGRILEFDYNYVMIVNPGFSHADLTVDTPDEIEHNPWKEHVDKHTVNPHTQQLDIDQYSTFVKHKEIKITVTDSVSSYSHYSDQINYVKNVYVNDKFVGTLSYYENNYIFRLIIGPSNVLNITSYSEEMIIMKVQVLLKELSAIFS